MTQTIVISDEAPESPSQGTISPGTTKNPSSSLSTNKRKTAVSQTTEANKTTTALKHKQCTLQQYYPTQSWYNSPGYSQNISLQQFQTHKVPTSTATHSTMALFLPIRGYTSLPSDVYIELSATIEKQCKIKISERLVQAADYEFARVRLPQKRDSTTEPGAKRPRTTILDHAMFAEIANQIAAQYNETFTTATLALLDMTLQAHRAIARHKALVDKFSTEILEEIPEDETKSPTATERGTKTDKPDIVDQSPMAAATTAASGLNPATKDITDIKQEPEHQAPTTSDRASLRTQLFKDIKCFSWKSTPTNDRNECIEINKFHKTIPSIYSAMVNTPSIKVKCKYANNPRTTLEALCVITGAKVAPEWLEKVFTTDYTRRGNSIDSVFRQHAADDQFQYRDYSTEALERNLPLGIGALFKGKSGGNFTGTNGFTTDTPLLCQMQINAPHNDANKDKVTYQWMLFFPLMNMVLTCHNHNDQHTWCMGKKTIDALVAEEHSTIDRLIGKLAFPRKQDNAKSLKFVSAVFIAPKGDNFRL